MSIALVMPSNHLILCLPLLLWPSIFPSIRVFSNEMVLHIRWPKYWSFSFSISLSNEYSGLISFRVSLGYEVMGLDAMILVFRMLSFKPAFSLSPFTFIKRLFGYSLFSAIRMVSFKYLKLLIFLLVVLIPACDSSSLSFHLMYSAYKLNKQSNNIQP